MNLRDLIVRTPLISYRSANGDFAGRIFLKPENLQPFGAYKLRGVAAVVEQAEPSVLAEGLHAASAGNMAQPVAFAARLLGVPCRIYVPDSAPQTKKAAIRALGADLIEVPFATAWASVRGELMLEEKGIFVHPTFTASLMDGYQRIAEEIIADLPEVDAMMVPFGIGGLASGIAAALARLQPDVSLFVVEQSAAAPMKAALSAGRPVPVERGRSFVDAIGTPEVLPSVFQSLGPALAGSEVVTEGAARQAVADLFRRHKLVVEGAGACALAAAEQLALRGSHKRIVCILSGGNIQETILKEILDEVPTGFSAEDP